MGLEEAGVGGAYAAMAKELRVKTDEMCHHVVGEERRILLGELAEIAAELDALQERTAEIAARVASRSPIRLARPA
jgi:hypothetical protein